MFLINHPRFDAIPAALARAKRNADARQLALSKWLIRRKRDGRYLATCGASGTLQPMLRIAGDEDGALQLFARRLQPRHSERARTLPFDGLEQRLRALGLQPASYAERTGLTLFAEPAQLAFAGFDRYRRPLWLASDAAKAWQAMQAAAREDGVVVEAISGFRSHDYQLGIFERKLARGQTVEDVLTVNAAPGFSEHHTGRALDIGTPGEPPAEESFEATPAFDWLTDNAARFGFAMSYPRGNPHGICYEPWHWRHEAALSPASA